MKETAIENYIKLLESSDHIKKDPEFVLALISALRDPQKFVDEFDPNDKIQDHVLGVLPILYDKFYFQKEISYLIDKKIHESVNNNNTRV